MDKMEEDLKKAENDDSKDLLQQLKGLTKTIYITLCAIAAPFLLFGTIYMGAKIDVYEDVCGKVHVSDEMIMDKLKQQDANTKMSDGAVKVKTQRYVTCPNERTEDYLY